MSCQHDNRDAPDDPKAVADNIRKTASDIIDAALRRDYTHCKAILNQFSDTELYTLFTVCNGVGRRANTMLNDRRAARLRGHTQSPISIIPSRKEVPEMPQGKPSKGTKADKRLKENKGK